MNGLRCICSLVACLLVDDACVAQVSSMPPVDERSPLEIIKSRHRMTIDGVSIPEFDDNPEFRFPVEGESINDCPSLKIGQEIPLLTGMTLEGKELTLEHSTKHKATLVIFWCSDCSACTGEMPYLNALHTVHGKHGFRIVGVNMDLRKARALKTVKRYEVGWPSIFDGEDGPIGEQWNISVFPTMLLLDTEGKILMGTDGLRSPTRFSLIGDQIDKSYVYPDGLRCALLRLCPPDHTRDSAQSSGGITKP